MHSLISPNPATGDEDDRMDNSSQDAVIRSTGKLKNAHRKSHLSSPRRKNCTHFSCIQVNFHHAKAASSVPSRRFTNNGLYVALIQEPWIIAGTTLGLRKKSGRLVNNAQYELRRIASLITNNITLFPLSYVISVDLVMGIVESL